MDNISFILPHGIVQEIRGIPVAENPDQEDILVRAFSKDGSFSLKSTCLIAKGFNILNLETSPHQWVWKVSTSPRIKIFLWLCTHCSVPTKEVLGSRGLNLNPTCELCGESPESILHTLRDCKVAKSVWKDLGIKEGNLEFFGLNLDAWLKNNCGMTSMYPRPHVPWKILFPQAVWMLWLHRNKAIFQIGKIEEGTSTDRKSVV